MCDVELDLVRLAVQILLLTRPWPKPSLRPTTFDSDGLMTSNNVYVPKGRPDFYDQT